MLTFDGSKLAFKENFRLKIVSLSFFSVFKYQTRLEIVFSTLISIALIQLFKR